MADTVYPLFLCPSPLTSWCIVRVIRNETAVEFYDSASFPDPRLFALTFDIIYLLAFLQDSCE